MNDRNMAAIFLFDIKRVFNIKNILIFLLFFSLSLYAVYYGTTKFDDFLDEEGNFSNYEKLKIKQYINYEQYGSFGFRVFLQPSPLSIFCHSSLLPIESNINTKEILNINSVHKGQKIFNANGRVGDFSTVFFVLASMLMMYFGLNTFISVASIWFHGTKKYIFAAICSRFIILAAYFSLVIVAAFLTAKLLGAPLSGKDAGIFFQYFFYVMLFITFFYCLGIFLAVMFRFNKVFMISAYLVWFIIIFGIPLISNMNLEKRAKRIKSNEIVNIEKLNNGKDFERKTEAYFKDLQEKKVKDIRPIAKKFVREYIEKILPLNTAIEANLNREVKQLITRHEEHSVIWPSSFYCFMSREFSSMGYYGYQEFLTYILRLKDEFYHYYFDKRYNRIDQTVEPFIKNDENIFRSKSLLPVNYWKGVSIICLYSLLLLGGTLVGLLRMLKPRQSNQRVKLDINQLELGKAYFYLSRNVPPGQKSGMLHYLKSHQAVVIEKPDPTWYDPGTSLKAWVRLESHLKGIDSHILRQYLEALGITEDRLKQKIKKLDNEEFYAAYLGIRLAQNAAMYVFDDFLNCVSREFEQTFKKALDKLKPHTVIIYFSSQMFDIRAKEKNKSRNRNQVFTDFTSTADTDRQDTQECRFVAVDLNDITLR
ncbi:MAG: ABC transporter permease [Candidatus Aminicenantes bacterium]|nr:MAG: ABC transporter permease [Candidatus Aminicenantes bacterium]